MRNRRINVQSSYSLGLILLCSLAACSSKKVKKPVQIENLETRLEVIQPIQSGQSSTVGVRNGVVLVQSKKSLPEEIRRLENQVYLLEDEIYGNRMLGNPGLYGVLKKCLYNLSDRRIGGNGKIASIEAEDRPTEREEQIHFGIDERGRVVSVSEENASDRMARFMEYRKVLSDRRKEFETRIDVCDLDFKNAANEQGLGSARDASLWTQDTRSGTRDWRGLSLKDEDKLRTKAFLGANVAEE